MNIDWQVGHTPPIDVQTTINSLLPSALILVGIARVVYDTTGKLNNDVKALPEDLRKEITLDVLEMYIGKILKEG